MLCTVYRCQVNTIVLSLVYPVTWQRTKWTE